MPSIELVGNGEYNFEIVGESFYQNNIKGSLGLDGRKSSKQFDVTLKCDDYNKYDNKAVGVYVGRYQVGNLSKANARKHRKLLKDIGYEGYNATTTGTMWGGGDKPTYGIWLDYSISATRKKYAGKTGNKKPEKISKGVVITYLIISVLLLIGFIKCINWVDSL